LRPRRRGPQKQAFPGRRLPGTPKSQGAEHACCRPCYVPVRGAAGFAFCQPVQKGDKGSPVNFTFYREPVPLLLFAAPCWWSAPCSLQGYRVTTAAAAQRVCPGATQHGHSVLQPLDSLSRTWVAAMMHCRPGTLQSSSVSIEARHASPLRSRNWKLAKVPDQRSTTTRRYRASGLQERVRRVVGPPSL